MIGCHGEAEHCARPIHASQAEHHHPRVLSPGKLQQSREVANAYSPEEQYTPHDSLDPSYLDPASLSFPLYYEQ